MHNLPLLKSSKIRLALNHLDVVEELTDHETRQILSGLQSMQETSMFWLGDFCLALERRLRLPVKAIAENFGCKPAVLYQARQVCAFYPRDRRKAALSYTHHRTAMKSSGKRPEVAEQYLGQAEEGHWSSRELSANISGARSTTSPSADEDGEFQRAVNGLGAARRFLSREEATPRQLRRLAELVNELSAALDGLL
jgi:hypothetical protein